MARALRSLSRATEHQRRVERAPDRHRHHPLGTELFRDDGELIERLGRPGDDHLAGGIEIRDPCLPVDTPARRLDALVVEAEHGDHRARGALGGLAHGGAALGDEAQPVFEVQRARGHESRVLAEAVTGRCRRLDAEALGGVEDDQALDERGDLGVVGSGQRFLVGLEEEMGEIASSDLRGETDELERRVVDPGRAHAGSLRALTGKRKCQQPSPLPSRSGRGARNLSL